MGKKDKICKVIQRIVSGIILYELSDPRLEFVTVTKIELTDDYQYCTVHVSVIASPSGQRKTMRALESAKGFIQKTLASRLETRVAPILKIKQDFTAERTFALEKKFEEIRQEREGEEKDSSPEQTSEEVSPSESPNEQ